MSLAPYDPLLTHSLSTSIYRDEIQNATSAIQLTIPDSKINDYLFYYLSNDPSKCPITNKISMRALKTLLSLGGILGKVPLIPVTFSYEAENKSLAFLGSGLNFVAFSCTAIWTTLKMVDKTLFSLNTTEHKQSKSYDRCRKMCLLAFNVFNGFTAQIPSLFLTWNYNQDKPYMLGFNVLDITYPAYSLNVLMASKVANFAVSRRQKKIADLKKEFMEKLENKIKAISKQECPDLIEAFEQMDYFSIPELKMNRFLELIQSDHLTGEDTSNPCIEGMKKGTAELLSYLLLSMQVFWNGFLTYKAMELRTDSSFFIGSVCLYVVICNIALNKLLLVKSTYRLINSLPLECKKTKTNYYICDRLSPISSIVSKLFILFIASASFMQAAKLSTDFIPEAFAFPSTVTYGLGLALMHYTPLRTFAHSASLKLVERFGNQSQKAQIRVYKTLTSIKKVLESTSLDSFAIFLLKNEMHNMTQYFMHKHEINHDDLTEFLKEPPRIYYDDGFSDDGELENRTLI